MKTKHEKKAQVFWRFHRVVESLKSYCIKKKRETPKPTKRAKNICKDYMSCKILSIK